MNARLCFPLCWAASCIFALAAGQVWSQDYQYGTGGFGKTLKQPTKNINRYLYRRDRYGNLVPYAPNPMHGNVDRYNPGFKGYSTQIPTTRQPHAGQSNDPQGIYPGQQRPIYIDPKLRQAYPQGGVPATGPQGARWVDPSLGPGSGYYKSGPMPGVGGQPTSGKGGQSRANYNREIGEQRQREVRECFEQQKRLPAKQRRPCKPTTQWRYPGHSGYVEGPVRGSLLNRVRDK